MGQPQGVEVDDGAVAHGLSDGLAREPRAVRQQAAALDADKGIATFGAFVIEALGMAEPSVGSHEGGAERLVPPPRAMASAGVDQPVITLLLPDAIEALVALGRLDEAEPLVALLEAGGRKPEGAWAEAVGARCRALLLAARGDVDGASAAFEQALASHDRLPQLRYDRARTLLVHARHQRRCRQRRAARASLEEAARLFDEVGCRQWAGTARDELGRLGLTPGPGDELTASERRVAELAASGRTVREIAAVLIVSTKTVEAHLTRVYRKLGIHTRAELGRIMASVPR